MPEINVLKSFEFTEKSGKTSLYTPGVHDVSDDMAAHWFVRAHTDNPIISEPKPGTPEYAQKQAGILARRKLVEAAIAQQAEDSKTDILTRARTEGTLAAAEEEAHRVAAEQEAEAQAAASESAAIREGRRIPPRR